MTVLFETPKIKQILLRKIPVQTSTFYHCFRTFMESLEFIQRSSGMHNYWGGMNGSVCVLYNGSRLYNVMTF